MLGSSFFESDFFGVAGFLLSLIAIPITFIVARQTRLRPEMHYVTDHDVLVEPKAELIDRGLTIAFADQKLRQVSRTYIAVWNNRGDTIKGSDILTEDPLRVQLEDLDTVVDVSIVWYSREQNRLTAHRDADDPSKVTIGFDFLDSNDGAVIQVVHEQGSPVLAGTIRGCTIQKKGDGNLTESALNQVRNKSVWRRIIRKGDGPSLSLSILCMLGAASYPFLDPFVQRLKNPHELIDPAKYDLRTVQGQEEFAREVGPMDSSDVDRFADWAILVLGLVLILGVIVTLYTRARSLVPVSILRYRAEDAKPVIADVPRQQSPGAPLANQ
ncbi:hypothetical protein OG767_00430 [Micromonospora sp. NBC_01392]|uniref:hypothetical protein n=1 Tax=Micromonospora sp. NBC_01392 TaxID=2903588 RepID=UPI0032558561